jgi:AcrR family transcriptional regulator
MGILERKEREKQEMRDLILNVATEMFIEEGYDKTSIRKIADKIEYSPATIYLYFKDKDEIFMPFTTKASISFLL